MTEGEAGMKQKIGLLLLGMGLLCGCQWQKPYDLQTAKKTALIVPDDAYHLAGQSLTVLEQNEYEPETTLFYVADEAELTKVIQYELDQQCFEIAYQSEQDIDLDAVAADLSLLNPFDIALTQKDTVYNNHRDECLYTAHHIQAKILDPQYEQAKAEAQRRVNELVDDSMSVDEQIAAIHDDIIIHCRYTDEQAATDPSLFQAAGVLLAGKGVCTGYSRALMMMAEAAGIPALYVSAETMNHGWNYVRFDDGWHHIDVTWDDPLPDQGQTASATYLHMDEAAFFAAGDHELTAAEQEKILMLAAAYF